MSIFSSGLVAHRPLVDVADNRHCRLVVVVTPMGSLSTNWCMLSDFTIFTKGNLNMNQHNWIKLNVFLDLIVMITWTFTGRTFNNRQYRTLKEWLPMIWELMLSLITPRSCFTVTRHSVWTRFPRQWHQRFTEWTYFHLRRKVACRRLMSCPLIDCTDVREILTFMVIIFKFAHKIILHSTFNNCNWVICDIN